MKYDLEERTAKFGEDVIEFVKAIQRNEINKPLINQIVRSGTSVGANCMEANQASSKKDFKNYKIKNYKIKNLIGILKIKSGIKSAKLDL